MKALGPRLQSEAKMRSSAEARLRGSADVSSRLVRYTLLAVKEIPELGYELKKLVLWLTMYFSLVLLLPCKMT